MSRLDGLSISFGLPGSPNLFSLTFTETDGVRVLVLEMSSIYVSLYFSSSDDTDVSVGESE